MVSLNERPSAREHNLSAINAPDRPKVGSSLTTDYTFAAFDRTLLALAETLGPSCVNDASPCDALLLVFKLRYRA